MMDPLYRELPNSDEFYYHTDVKIDFTKKLWYWNSTNEGREPHTVESELDSPLVRPTRFVRRLGPWISEKVVKETSWDNVDLHQSDFPYMLDAVAVNIYSDKVLYHIFVSFDSCVAIFYFAFYWSVSFGDRPLSPPVSVELNPQTRLIWTKTGALRYLLGNYCSMLRIQESNHCERKKAFDDETICKTGFYKCAGSESIKQVRIYHQWLTRNFNTASFWPELLTAVYDSLRCSSVIGQFESDKATYADAISNCQEFEDFTASDIERAQSEMHSPEFKNGLEEDKNFWWEKNSLVGDPLSGFGSNRYIIFWTQMTRFNQTHFHNKTSIFQQHSMFNIGDFQDHVLSNEHGRLRYFNIVSFIFHQYFEKYTWYITENIYFFFQKLKYSCKLLLPADHQCLDRSRCSLCRYMASHITQIISF